MQKDKHIKIKRLLNIVFSKRIIIIIAVLSISLFLGYRYSYHYKQSGQEDLLETILSFVNNERIKTIEQPSEINHKKDLLIFGILGMSISSFLIVIMYFLNNKIKSEEDIKKYFKLQILGAIPISSNKRYALTTYVNPKTYISKIIKSIGTNILCLTNTDNSKSILITNLKQEEGKTWIANNLAVTLAQANKKTILIDCNLRVPSEKNNLFGIEAEKGLSDFIKEITGQKIKNIELSRKYIRETRIPNLHLLVSGSIPKKPKELISSNNMKKLIHTLKYMYDVIILESYDCLKNKETIVLSAMADETILVTEGKKTKINHIKKSKKLIRRANGKILGVIFNQKKQRQKGLHSKLADREVDYLGIENEEVIEQKTITLNQIIKQAKINVKEEKRIKKGLPRKKYEIEEEEKDKRIVNIIRKVFDRVLSLEYRVNEEDEDINLIKTKHKNIQEDIKGLINKNNYISKKINSLNSDKKYILEQIESTKGKNRQELEDVKILKSSNINMAKEMRLIKKQIQILQAEITDLRQLDSKIKNTDNKISQAKLMQGLQIGNINKKIEKLKELQVSNNSKILEKIAVINPSAISSNTRNKKQEPKLQNNIISFDKIRAESKEKQKIVKKSFSINEDITFVELQKTSECVLNFDSIEDNKNIKRFS